MTTSDRNAGIIERGLRDPQFRDETISSALCAGVLEQVEGWILAEAPNGPGQMAGLVAIARRAGVRPSYLAGLLTNEEVLNVEALFGLAVAFDRLPTVAFTPFTERMRAAWFDQNIVQQE